MARILSWEDVLLIARWAIDGIKVGFAFKKRWKNTDPWTKWKVKIPLAFVISGLPTLASGIVPVLIFTFGLHMPFSDQPPNSTTFISSVSGVTMLLTSRRVFRWLEAVTDLDYPSYSCTTDGCGRASWHFSAAELKKVPQPYTCPRCGRTLQLQDKSTGWKYFWYRQGAFGISRKK